MKRLIEIAASKGFRTVISIDNDIWIIGFERNGKWSPPYSGDSMEEAMQDAMEDIKRIEAKP